MRVNAYREPTSCTVTDADKQLTVVALGIAAHTTMTTDDEIFLAIRAEGVAGALLGTTASTVCGATTAPA
jgi:hypothetical protein